MFTQAIDALLQGGKPLKAYPVNYYHGGAGLRKYTGRRCGLAQQISRTCFIAPVFVTSASLDFARSHMKRRRHFVYIGARRLVSINADYESAASAGGLSQIRLELCWRRIDVPATGISVANGGPYEQRTAPLKLPLSPL